MPDKGVGGPSARIEARKRFLRAAGIGIGAEILKILSCWISRTTLLLAMLVLGKINLPVNCRFASTPECRLNSPFEVKLSLDWGLGGRIWPATARLQASMSFPPDHFEKPGNGGCHPRGVGTCKFLCSNFYQDTPHKCQFLQIT